MTPLEAPESSLAATLTADAKSPPIKVPRPSRRKRVIVGSALAVLACGVLFRILNSSDRTGASAGPPVVAVAKVERKDLAETLTISAEFRPYQQAALHAKVAGYLQSIAVDIGDHVREGQALAQLDVPELKDDLGKATAALGASEQEVVRAEANSDDAHLACRRLQDVAKQHTKLVAEQDLDTAQARDAEAASALAAAKQRVAEATAEVGKVRSMIAYTTITAPFDGVITKRYADPGALIQAGTSSSAQMPVVDMAEDQRLRLVFPVPESAVALVKIGAPVRVTISALGEKIDAKVSRFSGKVERATRTMSTEVDIENPTSRITPGMYASVNLVVRESKGAVTVPVQAIAVGEKPKVFIVNSSSQVEERAVKLGLETPAEAEVTSGLEPGDLVIAGSRSGLQPGQKVTPKLIEITPAE
jgi:RND family efflux transporter MFP subunit